MRIENERRARTRIEMKGGALLFDGSGRQQVVVRDLSGTGVGVRSSSAPKPGEQVRVVISLDGKSWLDLRGVVRHVRNVVGAYDCGIDLSLSDPEVLGHVEAYVARASAMIASARQSKMYADRLAGAETLEPTLKPRDEGEQQGTGRHRMVRDSAGRLRPVSDTNVPRRQTPEATRKAETGERRASSSGARRVLRPTTNEQAKVGSGEHQARGSTPPDNPKQTPVSRRRQQQPGSPERKTPSSREIPAADPKLLKLFKAAVEEVTGDPKKKKK